MTVNNKIKDERTVVYSAQCNTDPQNKKCTRGKCNNMDTSHKRMLNERIRYKKLIPFIYCFKTGMKPKS